MWILFHRHGQRIPTRNIVPNVSEENALWTSLLPSKDIINQMNLKHEIISDSRNPTQWDMESEPYGCLTKVGIEKMYNVGVNIKKKFPLTSRSKFNIRSTNYLRTQLSVQSLLHGLLGLQSPLLYDSDDANNNNINNNFNNNNNEIKKPISVKHISECSLMFYEGRPTLAKELVAQSLSSDAITTIESSHILPKFTINYDFLKNNTVSNTDNIFLYNTNDVSINADVDRGYTTVLPLKGSNLSTILPKMKEIMINEFPLLSKTTYLKNQSTFDWLGCTDYFNCRIAHGIFIPKNLKIFYTISKLMLFTRYGTMFCNFKKQAAFAVPMLCDIISQFQSKDSINDNNSFEMDEKATGQIFSCHDVNILSLLFAFNAKILSNRKILNHNDINNVLNANDNQNSSSISRYNNSNSNDNNNNNDDNHSSSIDDSYVWPDYGSTLLIKHVDVSCNDIEGMNKYCRNTLNEELSSLSTIIRNNCDGSYNIYCGKSISQLVTESLLPNIIDDNHYIALYLDTLPLEVLGGIGNSGNIIRIGDIKSIAMRMIIRAL